MKEYIQPEVEVVKFTSEDVASNPGFGTGDDSAVSNVFSPSDIVW